MKNETNQRIEKLKVLFADLSEEHKAQAYDVTQQMQFLKKLRSEAEQLEESLL